MIRDITIGQYYPADSPLHKLDPRTKLMGTLVFIISVFLFNTILGYAVATVFLAAVIKISKIPVKFIFKGLKAIFIILIITMVFNVFLTPGEVLWSFGFLKATREGISLAGKMAIRLIYLVIGSSLMTLTTTPNQLTDGLERGLRPKGLPDIPVLLLPGQSAHDKGEADPSPVPSQEKRRFLLPGAPSEQQSDLL